MTVRRLLLLAALALGACSSQSAAAPPTCAEIAHPVQRGEDSYREELDRDDDGTACESTGANTTTTQATTTTVVATTTTTTENPEVASARGTARDYLDYSGFCRPSLISQLEYEGYNTLAATAAVDSLDVNWANETVKVAQSYVDYSDFSHPGLVDQLEYEGCEPDHAEAAATQVLGF